MVLCVFFLATLYHVSVPVRTYWTFNLPGAVFSLVSWIVGSYLLRWVLTGDRVGVDFGLRATGGAHRGDAVALHALDRGADRCGPERRLRLGLPAEGGDT